MNQSEKTYVVITGASGGIGSELAKVFAQNGYNLVLTSDEEAPVKALAENLKSSYNIQAYARFHDFSKTGEAETFYKEVQQFGVDVEMLANNAGFGKWTAFEQMSLQSMQDMINVNITAVTVLSRLFGTDMVKKGRGGIMNTASIASFLPGGVHSAVYCATKSYVLSLTNTLHEEFKGKNVRVSALCPPEVISGFQARSGASDYKPGGVFVNTPAEVARVGYEQFMKGKRVIRPWKPAAKVLFFFNGFMPDSLALNVSRKEAAKRFTP